MCITWWSDVRCDIFTKIKIINIFIASYGYHFLSFFFLEVLTLKIYLFSKLKVYNTILLTKSLYKDILTLSSIRTECQQLRSKYVAMCVNYSEFKLVDSLRVYCKKLLKFSNLIISNSLFGWTEKILVILTNSSNDMIGKS